MRIIGVAASVLAACCARGGGAPNAGGGSEEAPRVDLARVRAAVIGTWSYGQANDSGTVAWSFAFDDAKVERSETWTSINGPADTRSRGAVPYAIDERGAVAFASSESESMKFTAIVADGDTCAALHDRPCRVLGWDGFLAQSPTTYRREYDRTWNDGQRDRREGYVATLRFAHSPSELAAAGAPPCKLALEISAFGGKPVTRRFDFDCDVTPSARGRLAQLVVRGFDTERSGLTTVWSNHVAVHRIVDTDDRATYDSFRQAFQPVVYFDPADPWVLYFDRPGRYEGAR